MIQTSINVTTSCEFIHSYPDAPEEVSFLREPHRHMLHIVAEIEVFSDDRELEFIIVKRDLDFYLRFLELDKHSTRSCEMIGRSIIDHLQEEYGTNRDITVSVSEDGENGAVVKYKHH